MTEGQIGMWDVREDDIFAQSIQVGQPRRTIIFGNLLLRNPAGTTRSSDSTFESDRDVDLRQEHSQAISLSSGVPPLSNSIRLPRNSKGDLAGSGNRTYVLLASVDSRDQTESCCEVHAGCR